MLLALRQCGAQGGIAAHSTLGHQQSSESSAPIHTKVMIEGRRLLHTAQHKYTYCLGNHHFCSCTHPSSTNMPSITSPCWCRCLSLCNVSPMSLHDVTTHRHLPCSWDVHLGLSTCSVPYTQHASAPQEASLFLPCPLFCLCLAIDLALLMALLNVPASLSWIPHQHCIE